jgi:hypothetical protein
MFENWQGCTMVEERKKRREEKEEEEGKRESGSKGRHSRDASIPHFLRKMNHVLSPLPTEEREKD